MSALLLGFLHLTTALENGWSMHIPSSRRACARDERFRIACTRANPCSERECREYCDEDPQCNFYFTDGEKCKLHGTCEQKLTKIRGTTYRKNCDHGGFGRCGCDSQVARNFTTARWAGGTLYVHDPTSGSWEWDQIVDLGDAAVAAGCTPRHKPHMVLPSPDGRYVAVTYTGDQFVHVLDARSKEIVLCVDARHPAAGVVGGAIHTGAWYGNDRFVMVDMTGSVNGVPGGALHKYHLDFANRAFYHEASLSIGTTMSDRGTLGTKPIAMGTNPYGAYAHLFFVTDAKGAGSIVDVRTMTVARNIPLADFGPCLGGGLWTVPHPEDPEVLIAQYGSQGGAECLYQVNLKDLGIAKRYYLSADADDTHGIQFCKATSGEFFLVTTNRATATLDVLHYDSGKLAVSGWELNRAFGKKVLQPDVVYLRGNSELYIAARGPRPVSAVKPQNFFPHATPGMFKLTLTDCVAPEWDGGLKRSFLPTEQDRVPEITSDVHSVWGVNQEIWIIDQAATGSVQSFDVFSKCAAYPTAL